MYTRFEKAFFNPDLDQTRSAVTVIGKTDRPIQKYFVRLITETWLTLNNNF